MPSVIEAAGTTQGNSNSCVSGHNEEKSASNTNSHNGAVNSEADIHPASSTPATDNTLQHYALIDNETGLCLSCEDADTLRCSLSCIICDNDFHAVCKTAKKDKSGDEVICSSTFYKTFIQAAHKIGSFGSRPGNFVFMCDHCKTNLEHKRTVAPENKVDNIDKRVNELSNSMNEMKSMLKKLVNSNSTTTPINNLHQQPPPSRTVDKTNSWKRSVLITDIMKKPNGDSVNRKDLDDLAINNSIQVSNTRIKNDGSAIFECATEKDMEILTQKINESYPNVKMKHPAEFLPTISVSNMISEYSTTDLTEIILKQNPNIKNQVDNKESFEIIDIRSHKNNNKRFQAVIRVSGTIRNIIKSHSDRVYVGSQSCPVFDRFHVQRCNKCQKLNHWMKKCTATLPTCGYCSSEDHESSSCSFKDDTVKRCCPNCKNNKFRGVSNSHTAFDSECPSYKAAMEAMKRNIPYYQSKN